MTRFVGSAKPAGGRQMPDPALREPDPPPELDHPCRYLECPCCGSEAFEGVWGYDEWSGDWAWLFHEDMGPALCGCATWVSVGEEEGAYTNTDWECGPEAACNRD